MRRIRQNLDQGLGIIVILLFVLFQAGTSFASSEAINCGIYARRIIFDFGVAQSKAAKCAPDGVVADLGTKPNSELILDMGEGNEIVDDLGIDFYYYEWPNSPGIYLDWVEVAVAQDDGTGRPGQFAIVFIWGDIEEINNGTIPEKYLPEDPNKKIDGMDLFNKTGIGINIGKDDGVDYRFVRFQTHPPSAQPNSDSLAQVDAVERASHISPTETPQSTNTPTGTPLLLKTETPIPPSTTEAQTLTSTPTNASTSTGTETSTLIPIDIRTSTPSPTATATQLSNQTLTPTRTPFVTNTPSPTASNTPPPSRTPTLTPVAETPVATFTSTPTQSSSRTPTPTRTPSVTNTPSSTASNTPPPSRTPTLTPVAETPVTTFTSTPTQSSSRTPTPTRTPSVTNTPSSTASNTPPPSRTPTLTPVAETPVTTFTSTPTQSPNRTLTPTRTPFVTNTPSPTASNTPLPSRTPTLTPETITATHTRTSSPPSGTGTNPAPLKSTSTSTRTLGPTNTDSATVDYQATSTPTHPIIRNTSTPFWTPITAPTEEPDQPPSSHLGGSQCQSNLPPLTCREFWEKFWDGFIPDSPYVLGEQTQGVVIQMILERLLLLGVLALLVVLALFFGFRLPSQDKMLDGLAKERSGAKTIKQLGSIVRQVLIAGRTKAISIMRRLAKPKKGVIKGANNVQKNIDTQKKERRQ